MNNLDLLTKAFSFAEEKHRGQLDDNGKDYFSGHLIPVHLILSILNSEDTNLIIAGLLHDTLEDTNTTYKELVEEFNKDVADLVLEVTQEGEKDSFGYYFPRLHSARGISIKLADRLSNISRMENWDKERQEQYLRKTKFWKSSISKQPKKTICNRCEKEAVFMTSDFITKACFRCGSIFYTSSAPKVDYCPDCRVELNICKYCETKIN